MSKIIFALIPAAAIILLYIFNIGIPPFIINFYINHQVWFYIVLSITALTYIIVLFNLLSLYRHGKSVFIFIIIFAVLTFIFRDNILFFNTNKNSALVVRIEENIKDNKENTENIDETKNIESLKDSTERLTASTNIYTKIENEKSSNKKEENIISKIFNGMKNWFVNKIIYLKNNILKMSIIVLFCMRNKFIPSVDLINFKISGIDADGINLKVRLAIINNFFLPVKLKCVHVILYKNNDSIGHGNNFYSKSFQFRKYNTLELDLIINFLDAFLNIIPAITKRLNCTADIYVSFQILFIPISKNIRNVKL